MNELDKIKYAKMFIDKLAEGVNPIDNTPIPENDIVNNVRITRCFFYVSNVLKEVIENKDKVITTKRSKQPFSITEEQLSLFQYSALPITLSEIKNRLNSLIDPDNYKKLTYNDLKNWFVEIGAIQIIQQEDGTQKKVPTDYGKTLGICEENRVSLNNIKYSVLLFDINAQKIIINNINGIIDLKEKTTK